MKTDVVIVIIMAMSTISQFLNVLRKAHIRRSLMPSIFDIYFGEIDSWVV